MFYGLTAEELKGRRPLAKFLAIKLIVMFTFYQSFVVSTYRLLLSFSCDNVLQFSALEYRVLHGMSSPQCVDLCSIFLHSYPVLDSNQHSQRTQRPRYLYRGKTPRYSFPFCSSQIQMVFFSVFMMWAYSPAEYMKEGATPTSIWRPLWDSFVILPVR
jgi:hypothetical protein